MCEEKHEFTTELFEETFGDNAADAYYVYYLDDDLMHFMSDEFDEKFDTFTTDFSKASLFTKTQAKVVLILGRALGYDMHMAHIATKVVWDC